MRSSILGLHCDCFVWYYIVTNCLGQYCYQVQFSCTKKIVITQLVVYGYYFLDTAFSPLPWDYIVTTSMILLCCKSPNTILIPLPWFYIVPALLRLHCCTSRNSCCRSPALHCSLVLHCYHFPYSSLLQIPDTTLLFGRFPLKPLSTLG